MPLRRVMRQRSSGSVKLSGQPSFCRIHWLGRLECLECKCISIFIVILRYFVPSAFSTSGRGDGFYRIIIMTRKLDDILAGACITGDDGISGCEYANNLI
jgi:hypothetical protein